MKLNAVIKIVFLLLITELCLGGGGRFTAFGLVSLRMVLFAIALALTGIALFKSENRIAIQKEFRTLITLFILTALIGLVTGISNGADIKFWREDIKPLAYFMILPFYLIAVQDTKSFSSISKVIMTASVIIASLFLVILALIHLQIIPFLSFYKATIRSEELFFRGEFTFFYKGFIYIAIGIIFFYFLVDRPIKYVAIIFLSGILFLSLTRGMILALSLTFVVYFLLNRAFWKLSVVAITAVLILIKGASLITNLSLWLNANKEFTFTHAPSVNRSGDILLGDRNYSDSQRIIQVKEVFASTSFSSAWIGHGFGIGVPDRPVHMEISYLEIFHKQGIIGLVFWCVLLWMIWMRYRPVSDMPYAKAFFFSALFVFLQSFTNQYVNNPIGLSMVLLSLVGLDRLNQNNGHE